MRDVRLLRTHFDGKIPSCTSNDAEQLKIALSKCKKNTGISNSLDKILPDTRPSTSFETRTKTEPINPRDVSPIKSPVFSLHELKSEKCFKYMCPVSWAEKIMTIRRLVIF